MRTVNRYSVIGGAWLIALMGSALSAQVGSASLSGTVRSNDGVPLADAIVIVGARRTLTDSLGHYRLDSLGAGPTRVGARRMGFTGRDSVLTLRADAPSRWDIALKESELFKTFEQERAEANAKDAASGHIDSVASKLLRPSGDRVLPLGAFGSRLFATMVAQRGVDSNTVLSPLSAGLALAITRLGARGTTAAALDQALTLSLDQRAIEQRGAATMAAFDHRTDVTLELGNAIWVDRVAQPMPAFREAVARWRAGIARVPLATPEATASINRWVDSVTHGKIEKILDKPLPDTARVFIANAVYFKGKWLEPFEKSEPHPGDFTLPSGARITVPRMSRVGDIGYRRDSGYQTIRLPYRTGKVAMYIVLPDRGVKFDAVARTLAAGGLAPSTAPLDVRPVHVVLPRFHSELTMSLVEPLKALGLGVALDCDSADFRGMARSADPSIDMPLCIGSVVQKVYIDVDEEGTEAAAVTGIGMVTVTAAPPPPLEFIVDRPFLFVLRDEVTGTDLFVGRIARP